MSSRDAGSIPAMLDADLQKRVQRLLRGERRSDDLDRLFLGLRDRSHGRESVREIGDFVAHRDQREKGPVTQKARDVFLSFHSWFRIRAGQPFDLAHIRKVSAANLRVATDDQIAARLGLTRSVAKSVLEQALRKLEKGKDATPRERLAVDYFGGAFIWNPAFTDAIVTDDLASLLVKTGFLAVADRPAFEAMSPFIALYVITLIHGSTVLLDDGGRAALVAGFDNQQARLEVKARLEFNDLGKPMTAPVCMFWTSLNGADHVAEILRANPDEWGGPLEIDGDGRLAPLA
jgi:hypothetical protein